MAEASKEKDDFVKKLLQSLKSESVLELLHEIIENTVEEAVSHRTEELNKRIDALKRESDVKDGTVAALRQKSSKLKTKYQWRTSLSCSTIIKIDLQISCFLVLKLLQLMLQLSRELLRAVL